jgi:hypothetical protein
VHDRYRSYSVAIADACFGMRPAWCKEFLSRMAARKPEFWIVFNTRPEYFDAEDVEMLTELKIVIQFGSVSGRHVFPGVAE